MPQDRRPFFYEALPYEPFAQQDQCVIQPPQEEVPCRAVPEAGKRPYDQEVENLALFAAAVASERDIDIVAEPC